jgi:uncharacterized protein (DUF433 family)
MQIGAITFDRNTLGGEAVFTGTRIPVKTLFNSLDSGESIGDFLRDFPEVTRDQILEVLGYARLLTTSSTVIRTNGTLLEIFGNPLVPSEDILLLESQITAAINQHRSSISKSPFTFNPDVSTIARIHSADMAQNKVPLGHDGFQARVAEAQRIVRASGAGAENVAQGFTRADELLQSWLAEPSHKANIESELHFAGIGVERSGDGQNFFTLLIL